MTILDNLPPFFHLNFLFKMNKRREEKKVIRKISYQTVLVCTFIFLLGGISLSIEKQKWCPLCGMDLEVYRKTSHRHTFKDGSQEAYCSLHCAAIVYQQKKDQIVKIEAADFVTGGYFEADKAHYLVGSDLPGVMTVVSKKAFSSSDDAKRFQKEHGGSIVGFKEALAMALADLPKDKEMLKEKMSKAAKMGMKVAEKYKCFDCHGPEGKGIGKAPAWTSPAFAKRMDSKVKIKDAILKAKGDHPSFEGKIPAKELQSLMLYIREIRSTK